MAIVFASITRVNSVVPVVVDEVAIRESLQNIPGRSQFCFFFDLIWSTLLDLNQT